MQPSKIGITSFGSLKLQIWILQKQHWLCKTVNQRGERGEADTRDPRVSETVIGEKLAAGKAQHDEVSAGSKGTYVFLSSRRLC